MKKYITTLSAWWKRQSTRRKIFYGVLAALVLYIVFHKGNTTGDSVVETARRQTLVRSISASGSVVSSTDLSLGFEQSKMISSIRVYVGQKVKKGDILASLSNGNERAALSSAKGALLAAQARYKKVLEGSSSQEVRLAQVQLDNAKRTLLSSGLVAKPEDPSDTIAPTISGTYTGTEGIYRIELNTLAQNTLEYGGLETGTIRVTEGVPQKLGTKGLYVQFAPTTLKQISNGTMWTISIPNVESESYVANKALVDEKEASLAITQATARQPDIDAALADVITAQAGVDTANATLEKTILRAPADGTITAVNVKIGEIAQVGTDAVALQDVSNLYLEANVNESSIKSVALGQPVTVTFDAFPGDTYYASVSSIDPAATIENNVVNYKIKALLTDTDAIRPGMTANMVVKTAEVADVLVLPARVITTKDGVQTVALITDERRNRTVERTVTTGLKGDGDLVEIQTGLTDGDRVLWSPVK
jgi:HlyD family secretion protein